MADQFYPLEYRHTTRGWVETGTVASTLTGARRMLAAVHPSKADRYRIGDPRPVGRSVGRLTIRIGG
jgi:hypothetical protein